MSWYDLPRDGPAFDAMAKGLRRNPGETYALGPFAPVMHRGRWHIAAIEDPLYPASSVILIDPRDGSMTFPDGEQSALWGMGTLERNTLTLFVHGLAFARVWAECRAAAIRAARMDRTRSHDIEASHMPGVAIVGDYASITDWSAVAWAPAVAIDKPALAEPVAAMLSRKRAA